MRIHSPAFTAKAHTILLTWRESHCRGECAAPLSGTGQCSRCRRSCRRRWRACRRAGGGGQGAAPTTTGRPAGPPPGTQTPAPPGPETNTLTFVLELLRGVQRGDLRQGVVGGGAPWGGGGRWYSEAYAALTGGGGCAWGRGRRASHAPSSRGTSVEKEYLYRYRILRTAEKKNSLEFCFPILPIPETLK